MRAAAACVVLAVAAAACGETRTPSEPSPPPLTALTPVAPTDEWPSSTPEAEGLDPAPLLNLVTRIHRRDYGAINSLLVARNGRLVVEEYFNGWSAERTHTQQSVSKSVTSLLVGLAIQAGRLRLDDRVTSFFPSYDPIANLDDRKRATTVRDLLTMRSGFDWTESTYAGSPLQRMNDCGCDWLRFVLDWPMREPPGSRWEYISGSTILLGGIVGAATGQRIDRFAQDRLFAPLGVSGASWIQGLPDGLPHTGGGLQLRPREHRSRRVARTDVWKLSHRLRLSLVDARRRGGRGVRRARSVDFHLAAAERRCHDHREQRGRQHRARNRILLHRARGSSALKCKQP
jgi:CubicO group peptidase (beta-lactamase class C family)